MSRLGANRRRENFPYSVQAAGSAGAGPHSCPRFAPGLGGPALQLHREGLCATPIRCDQLRCSSRENWLIASEGVAGCSEAS